MKKFGGYNCGEKGRRIRYIGGFTEYKVSTDTDLAKNNDNNIDIVRAHPLYRSRDPWHDWVKIAWDESSDNMVLEAKVEAKVLAYLDFQKQCMLLSTSPIGVKMIVTVTLISRMMETNT